VFAGLGHVCRYCGLLRASLAAHQEARRLDPLISTTVMRTYFMHGDYEKALEVFASDYGYGTGVALAALGRPQEAVAMLRERESKKALGKTVFDFLAGAAGGEPRGKFGSEQAVDEGDISGIRKACTTWRGSAVIWRSVTGLSRCFHERSGMGFLLSRKRCGIRGSMRCERNRNSRRCCGRRMRYNRRHRRRLWRPEEMPCSGLQARSSEPTNGVLLRCKHLVTCRP